MKKIYAYLVVLFVASSVSAQTIQPCSTCLPEGITFTTQSQIDNFQTNYPGCTEIEGNVTIKSQFDITNLNGLNLLTAIGGNLTLDSNNTLTSLSRLEELTSIGGELFDL